MVVWLMGSCSIFGDDVVKAALRFQVWAGERRMGVQVVEGKRERRERYVGSLFLKNGGDYVKVDYREGRRSGLVEYAGPKACEFYRRAVGEEGEATFEKVGRVTLPRSGAYVVLLKMSGPVAAPVMDPLLLPYDDSFLKKGQILVMNQTGGDVACRVSEGKRVGVRAGRDRVVQLARGARSIYLHAFSRSGGEGWVEEFARPYALREDAKSVLIFYRDVEGGPLRVKLYSGL